MTEPHHTDYPRVYYQADPRNDCPAACVQCQHTVFQLRALGWKCERCGTGGQVRGVFITEVKL